MSTVQGLKSKVLNGGILLTLRSLVAAVLSLVSVIVIARILGLKNYGIATVSIGIIYFLTWTCRLGLHTHLVRDRELPDDGPRQVLSFYHALGFLLCSILWLAAPLAGKFTGQIEVTHALRALLPVVWLDLVGMVSISMLERNLRFGQVGLIESVSQLGNCVISIALVFAGASYWGPIIGTVFQYTLQTTLACRLYPVSWRWGWDWKFLKPALRFGLAYSGADWIANCKSLRISVLVSGIAGIEAAGIVGMANRFADQMSMLRLVVRRMSISVMSKFVEDPDAARAAVSRGMIYQAMLVGPVCAGFSCVAVWVIPAVFGSEWVLSAKIFPLFALATLGSSLFDLHAAVLHAAGRNADVAKGNLLYVSVLWVGGIILLPVFGLWGYGVSELLALPSYQLLHRLFSKTYGSPEYRPAFWVSAAAVPPMIASIFLSPVPAMGIFLLSYALLFLMNGGIRENLRELNLFARKKPREVSPESDAPVTEVNAGAGA